jgi:hypothetical protein
MKNLHIIPTNDPSKLIKNNLGYGIVSDAWKQFDIDLIQAQYQNIYITDNSEIIASWVLNTHTNKAYYLNGFYGIQPFVKKIILTTDPDLIQDGVQAIDDEFLKWFIQNPSCEEVEIKPFCKKLTCKNKECNVCCQELNYKIIIPKEEPKQKTIEEAADLWSIEPNNVHPTDSYIAKKGFLEGAKSDAARDYWFSEFKKK